MLVPDEHSSTLRPADRGFSCELHRLHSEIPASHWGISREDLDFFEEEVRVLWKRGEIPDSEAFPNPFHDNPEIGPSMYQVKEYYIKPTTLDAGGMGWALMRNPKGGKCDAFVTHGWSEGAFEFCSKLRRMWPWRTRYVYVCFLANPQNSDIGSLISDPLESPFCLAMQSSKTLLVLPNRSCSIYMRLWCVFEAHLALQMGHQIVLPSRPRNKDAISIMLPGVVLFIGTVCIWFCLPIKLRLAGLMSLWLLSLPCVQLAFFLYTLCSGCFPRISSCTMLFIIGLEWGCWAWEIKGVIFGGGNISQTLQLSWIEVPNLLFGLECFVQALDVLKAEALKQEANQLQFKTVREAECTVPQDEARIRGVIDGKERDIDLAISTLMAVGRFNHGVSWNLGLGMSRSRARRGVSTLRMVLICLYWSVIPLAIVQMAKLGDSLGSCLLAGAAIKIIVVVSTIVAVCAARDAATFLVEALFFACTVDWIALMIAVWFCFYPAPMHPGQTDMHTWSNVWLVSACCCLAATLLACGCFYGGWFRPCTQKQDCSSWSDSDISESGDSSDEVSHD